MSGPPLADVRTPQSYVLMFSVPILPPMNTSATRRHWAVHHRAVKQWRAIVAAATAGLRPEKPLQRSRVTLVRLSSVEPDHENLAMSFKPVLDALVHCGVLVDDGPAHVERVYRWEKVAPRRGMVGVRVEALP
jgi:Holliday junction resolvase RusA-like endonuclease